MRIVLGLALLVGCSTVQLKQPFESNLSQNLKDAISGNWEVDGDVLYVRFDQDQIKVAGIEWRDGSFTLEKGEGTLREINGHLFAAIRFFENGEWSGYHLAKVILADETIGFQLPDAEQFAKLVSRKELRGHIEGEENKDVIINDLDQLEKVLSKNHEHLFKPSEDKPLKKLK